MYTATHPLLIGEIIVDFTLMPPGQEPKMRLGGITHAARGFHAAGQKFSVAAVLPQYLEKTARAYFARHGCEQFTVLGYVSGAPNVIVIMDAIELADQGYEAILRDEKSVVLTDVGKDTFASYRAGLIFPGSYDLRRVAEIMPADIQFYIDVAYDVKSVQDLVPLFPRIRTILLSTSSKLFTESGSTGIDELAKTFSSLKPEEIILKENRGGSRVHVYKDQKVTAIPAQLGKTLNSVGVGDVFAASYLLHREHGPVEAAWRATFAASAYSQTTEPDRFCDYVQRDLKLSLDDMQALGGTSLPWEARQQFQIYLAAPDFKNADRRAIERALGSLQYHNSKVRRPIQEIGELPLGADEISLRSTYERDVELLRSCQLVFAVPTGRDPGTLVEVGIAIEAGIPVVVYDPARECANTMVMAGSKCYSRDLDECLNETFSALSRCKK
jgi:nucleoside 2-deoxyribosyltransferase